MINETSSVLNKYLPVLPKTYEIKILLNQLIVFKNDNEQIIEILKQINSILQYNREESVNNIEQLTKFVENNFDNLTVKIIIKTFTTLSKFLSHNSSLQIILSRNFYKTLFFIITEKDNPDEENNYLIKNIENTIKMCGSHISNDIKTNIDEIGNKCLSNEIKINKKVILLEILITFIKGAPMVSFNKMMKTESFLMKLILIYYKDSYFDMRKIISDLTYYFFSLIENRDNNIKKNYFKIIYDLIINNFKNSNNNKKPNDNDIFIIHGSILLIKSIIIMKEFFNEKSNEILEILFKFKNSKYLPIKNRIIEYIPDLTDYLINNKILFEKFCDFLIDEYISNKDEYTNTLILSSLEKLSLKIPKEFFEYRAEKIIICLKKKFENKKYIIKRDEVECLSELLTNYHNSIMKKIPLNLIFEKIFECGFNETHVNFLQKLINIENDTSDEEIITVILVSLNVISLILSKKINLNNSFQNISKNIKLLNNKSSKKHFMNIFKTTRKQIGNVLIEYLEKEQKNKLTFEAVKLQMSRSAINFLKIINNPYFSKDILLFYQNNCFPFLKEKIKSIEKIEIISLITSKWIPYNIEDKEIKDVKEQLVDDLLNYFLTIKNDNIKKAILDNLDERYDLIMSRENFLKKLFLLFDCSESHLKVGLVKILGRLKKYNPISISMFLQKEIMRIYSILEFSSDVFDKEKAISLLSFYINYTKDITLEFFDKKIFEVLIREIKNNENIYDTESSYSLSDMQEKEYNDDLNLKISSILTELISNSCNIGNNENKEAYFKDIIEECINNLTENTNNTSQEILLKTILTVFEHSEKNWDVYSNFSELVYILIKILKFSNSKPTRVYALKIFGYIGAMDPDKLDIFLTLQKNALDNDGLNNLEDKNFQIFDENESEKSYRKRNKKKFIKDVVNYLYHFNELSNNLNYEGFISKREYNQNQLLNEVISSLMNIFNDDNKKEHIKIILKILIQIIKYLKKERDKQEKDSKENNKKSFENEAIELILNSFVKDSSKNINKEYKVTIIYYIILLFKNDITGHFTDILNLVSDTIKHDELVEISLSILKELLEADSQSLDNYFQKLIPILLDLLNKEAEKVGSILIQDNSSITKIIECFCIMSGKISDYLNIILDEIFDLLNLSIINIQKKNLNSESSQNEKDINNNNIHNFQLYVTDKIKAQPDIYNSYDSINNNNLESDFNFNSNSLINNEDSNILNLNNKNNLLLNNSPLEEVKIMKKYKRKNTLIQGTSSAKKRLTYKKIITNTFDNKIFKKILDFIKKTIFLDNLHEYLPLLINILNKYICFCPELRKDIIEFYFELLTRKPNEMNCYMPFLLKLIYTYKIPIIDYSKKVKFSPNDLENSFEEEKEKQYSENKKESISIGDNSLLEKYILNKSFSSSIEKDNNDISKNLENILDDFNPKNYSLKDDWKEWFWSSSKQLFNYSPNQILRYCSKMSDSLPNLYKYAFYEVWKKFNKTQKIEIISYLTIVIKKETLPNDIRLIILNLVEFIEREQNYIEYFDNLDLATAAKKCKADAKELYYIENYYRMTNDKNSLKRLTDIYYELNLPESVVGISIIEKNNPIFKKDNWFLKLRQWDSALKVIKEKRKNEPPYNIDLIMDNFACLEGLSDWDNLLLLNDEIQNKKSDIFITENDNIKYKKINYYIAESALYLNKWDKLQACINEMEPVNDEEKFEKKLYETILSIKDGELTRAKDYIEEARISLLDRIKILLTESYERAYKLLLLNDHLYQLEEIIQLKKCQNEEKIINKNLMNKKRFILTKENLKNRWDHRMKIVSEDSRAYEKILAIRNLVFTYEEDYEKHLDLAKICREDDDFKKCMNILERLKQKTKDINISLAVTLNFSKCLNENFIYTDNIKAREELEKIIKEKFEINENEQVSKKLMSKFYCYYSFLLINELSSEKIKNNLTEKDVNNILQYLELSTKYNEKNYKAWHLYALLNYKFFEYEKKTKINYAINAIEGFAKSICIGEKKNMSKILQDLLFLLNIWFQVGMEETIDKLMNEKIQTISLESWFLVIPQLLARINITNPLIRKTLIFLLKKIGLKNPRCLTYPLTVLHNSKSKIRAEAVSLILEEIKKEHEQLFKECELIINELNRCALCLHEQWTESIEESANLLYQKNDYKGSTKILSELHKKMLNPPKTIYEVHFHQTYRSELSEAYKLLQDYLENDNMTSLKEAWNIYHSCFRTISDNYSNIEYLDLRNISPELFKFRESEIEIPGIYQSLGNESSNSVIKISSFSPKLTVLNSKEHPRKINIYGNDGKEYPFLLKGHEDIRQDERVMQLFGLINTLLSKDSDTREKNLFIKRYPVIPLSHNTGIIGWVSNCDTLHQLIKDYRQINKVDVNIEHHLMASFNRNFDSSLRMNKLEIFKHALNNTSGLDLYKILWNKSQSAEDWLDRRTNYSRSLAVMSIVGYILGLGDRHPSNIMLDRISGKVLHIDFGDCFEVAMKRDKFPEKVPFRLTRMLIKALEIGGIEGSFRITCENVMRVIRENKDSLNVILAAFVHDPLISFRLLIPLIIKQARNKSRYDGGVGVEKKKEENEEKNSSKPKIIEAIINKNKRDEKELEKKRMGSDERKLYNELEEKDEAESDDLNEIAKIVLERISDKLNGTDFNKNEELKIHDQVQRLIRQAASHENLSQSYLGWRPFW